MNKKYFYKYAISKQQQIQKESNHLFQVALLFFFLKYNHYCISAYYITLGTNMTILYSKHSFIECFVCPINAK